MTVLAAPRGRAGGIVGRRAADIVPPLVVAVAVLVSRSAAAPDRRIVLAAPHGHRWVLSCLQVAPELEESIHFAGLSGPRRSRQVVLSFKASEVPEVRWQLSRLAADGAPPPDTEAMPLFRPFMLAHPLEDAVLDLADYVAEWKWDGIRMQLVHASGETRLYSRTGDDITHSFPEMAEALDIPAVLDGELLVRGSHQGGEAGGAASFNALQQRLGRKTVSKKMLAEFPAFVRLYDVLILDGEDLRELPWSERRARLEALMPRLPAERFDLSAVVDADHFEHLAEIRSRTRDEAIEGLMLKRRDSPYVAGRKTGLWYKWKRDPLLVDCVLMYAQRGSGKRSSFYSDYTFGCWDGDPDQGAELLPVGKAYFGFTDEELKQLDRYVRNHTVNRFGPVRETDKSLVFEVAFDSVHESKRHKSGLAMRFPRIHRIRWDKPAHEADRIEALKSLVRD